MKIIIVGQSPVNLEALDAALRVALGGAVAGVSLGRGEVVVHLMDSASPAQQNQARSVVEAHNPLTLTAEQQSNQTRRARLAAYRGQFGDDMNPADFDTAPALVKALSQRLAWLEAEVRALRRGE